MSYKRTNDNVEKIVKNITYEYKRTDTKPKKNRYVTISRPKTTKRPRSRNERTEIDDNTIAPNLYDEI